jgi:hypothetical protein
MVWLQLLSQGPSHLESKMCHIPHGLRDMATAVVIYGHIGDYMTTGGVLYCI